MAEMNIFGGAIAAFIVVVVGLAFLTTSSDTISETTDTYNQLHEIALVNGTPVSINDSTHTLVSVASVSVGGTTLRADTDYKVDTTAGTINITNSSYASGNYNVSYAYQSTSYVNNAAARSTIALIKIMFALAVFLSAAAFINWKMFDM